MGVCQLIAEILPQNSSKRKLEDTQLVTGDECFEQDFVVELGFKTCGSSLISGVFLTPWVQITHYPVTQTGLDLW